MTIEHVGTPAGVATPVDLRLHHLQDLIGAEGVPFVPPTTIRRDGAPTHGGGRLNGVPSCPRKTCRSQKRRVERGETRVLRLPCVKISAAQPIAKLLLRPSGIIRVFDIRVNILGHLRRHAGEGDQVRVLFAIPVQHTQGGAAISPNVVLNRGGVAGEGQLHLQCVPRGELFIDGRVLGGGGGAETSEPIHLQQAAAAELFQVIVEDVFALVGAVRPRHAIDVEANPQVIGKYVLRVEIRFAVHIIGKFPVLARCKNIIVVAAVSGLEELHSR